MTISSDFVKIQFVVADWKSWWINKYLVVFRKLTNYQLMDLEQQRAGQVHCFKQVVVGLRAHKEFLIDPARSPNGYTMARCTIRSIIFQKTFKLNKQ